MLTIILKDNVLTFKGDQEALTALMWCVSDVENETNNTDVSCMTTPVLLNGEPVKVIIRYTKSINLGG